MSTNFIYFRHYTEVNGGLDKPSLLVSVSQLPQMSKLRLGMAEIIFVIEDSSGHSESQNFSCVEFWGLTPTYTSTIVTIFGDRSQNVTTIRIGSVSFSVLFFGFGLGLPCPSLSCLLLCACACVLVCSSIGYHIY